MTERTESTNSEHPNSGHGDDFHWDGTVSPIDLTDLHCPPRLVCDWLPQLDSGIDFLQPHGD